MAPTDAAAVKADPKLRLVVSDALGYSSITNNLDNGPRANTPYGKNPLVRQAFDAAIDRAALVQVVFNDMYAPSVQPVSASSPFYDPSLKPPPRDVAKAKALLKQAGVTLPVKLELLTPNQPDVLQVAEVIQSMAAEAGFDVRIQAMEFASSLQASQRGEYEVYLIGWSGRVDVDGNTYPVPAYRAGQQRQPLQQSQRWTSCWRGRGARRMSPGGAPITIRCGRNCGAICRSPIFITRATSSRCRRSCTGSGRSRTA